jgi:protease IV
MTSGSLLRRVFGSIARTLDRVRKTLHLLVMLVLLALVLGAIVPDQPRIPVSAALLLEPQGVIVDQLSGDAFERAIARAQGIALQETLLRDLIEALRAAKDDARIKVVVLKLDAMSGAGLSKLQELAEELAAFKESGKPVIAVGDGFDRNQYYLAAHADEVYMHPLGLVLVDGYSRYLPYYKSALDKLYVDYNVWTVGEYKSFVEPITRDDMSSEDREASSAYLDVLWTSYQSDVAAARELAPDALQRYADEIPALLREVGGDTGRLALDYGLVDDLLPRDGVRERVKEIVGNGPASADEKDGYPSIGHDAYLAAVRARQVPSDHASQVAVVVASGTILDGVQPPGTIGGESTAELIRRATEEETVKALVLRVDSPGGSSFASDVILRAIEVFQQSGRPVVVSMGSVAASGGYWISMSADEIWASDTTLTGSIGVGATIPTFQRTLGQLGVRVDGVGTTELAGGLDLTRALGANIKEVIGQSVEFTYDQFISKVAAGREREIADVDRVARGRVWIGSQAQERGLVDRLGDLDDAIASAAELAGLAEGAYGIEYVEPQLSVADRLLLELIGSTAPVAALFGFEPKLPHSLKALLTAAAEPLAFLARFNDPRGIYAYCFCDVR